MAQLCKVTKAHPYITSGYGAALKNRPGIILPPAPGGYVKVNFHEKVQILKATKRTETRNVEVEAKNLPKIAHER